MLDTRITLASSSIISSTRFGKPIPGIDCCGIECDDPTPRIAAAIMGMISCMDIGKHDSAGQKSSERFDHD